MRKVTMLTFLALLSFSALLANEVVLGSGVQDVITKEAIARQPNVIPVTPWSNKTIPANRLETKGLHGEVLEPTSQSGERFESMIDYTNFPDGPYGGFIFEGTDSALVWFRPATECTVNKIDVRFNSDGELVGETVYLQLYSVKETWVEGLGGNGTYDFSQADYISGDNGPHDQLLWEAPINVTEVGINTQYEVNLADWGGIVDVGSNDFIVVIGVPEGNGGGADFYYSQFWNDRGQHHGWKYYHGAAGWKSRFNFMFMATVDYYGDPPPFITDETDLDDVYFSDDPGPYSVSANIYDVGTATFTGGLTAIEFRYSVNGVADTLDLSAQIPSADSMYTAELTGLVVGDVVDYSFYAADNGADDVGGIMHEATSPLPLLFNVLEANPLASILIVDDNTAGVAADYWAPILEEGGWVFDYWNVVANGIPTAGILANYQTLLWAQGTATGGILADFGMDDILIAPFLDAGGNFFLSSSDYMGIVEDNFSGEWLSPTLSTFLPGYLHVSDYVSDANVGTVSELSDDTLYTGVAGSLISDDYADVEFEVNPGAIGFSNWADEANATSDAEVAFMVYSNYLDEDWVEAGVLYDGTYKTVFLPWQFEAIVDDAIRFDVMANILSFFNELATPKVKYDGGDRYAQGTGAGDVVVLGSATDGDGTIVSMSVDYTLDGGANWLSVAMTAGEAAIPALAIGDTVSFMVTATDNDGLIGKSNTINVWKIDFTPAADVLYVGDDYYTWYYADDYDAANYARTQTAAAAASLTIQYYDLDELFLMDTRSILNQYSAVIWNAYADWDGAYMPVASFDNPLTGYVANGGELLYSSEEMIGTWFDWPQYQDFIAGDFMYDVLNVNWAANDFGLDSTITDATGDFTEGLGNFNLESSNFAFGNMNDLCDPITFWGGDYASGPFTSYEGVLGWGENPMSSQTPNTLFLAFSMMMMPDDIYASFMSMWFGGVAVDERTSLPTEFALANNYPNPFNPSTTIAFDVPASSQVMITVYNVLGQKVIDLVNSDYAAGAYNVAWNGVDAAGTPVSSGLYMYKMTAGNFTATSKMLYLK